MRRAKRFEVSSEFFDQIFTARPRGKALFKGISSDVPADMHITGTAGYDPTRGGGGVWTFICESATFDELAEGEEPPLFLPIFTAYYNEEPK